MKISPNEADRSKYLYAVRDYWGYLWFVEWMGSKDGVHTFQVFKREKQIREFCSKRSRHHGPYFLTTQANSYDLEHNKESDYAAIEGVGDGRLMTGVRLAVGSAVTQLEESLESWALNE